MSGQSSISIPPEKIRKTGFLTFLGGTEMEHWAEMGEHAILYRVRRKIMQFY